MKLYLSPGACSMSCHIAFEEAGLKFEPMLNAQNEIKKLNPMESVPVLQFESTDAYPNQVLTQNIAIMTYVGSTPQGAKLFPKPGTYEYMNTYKWLSFVAADLHPAFSPLWREGLKEEEKTQCVANIKGLLMTVNDQLGKTEYIAGSQFTAADAYLFTVYGWCNFLKIDTHEYKNINTYSTRIYQRPAVQAVMKREGLLK